MGQGKETKNLNLIDVLLKLFPGIGGVWMKESSGADEFKYDIFDTL
jgi:hypothetical protein